APVLVKAAQAVSPSGGVRCAPATVTARSVRGTCTRKTPSFSFHSPFSPVACSIRAVSRPFGAARTAGAARSTATMSFMPGAYVTAARRDATNVHEKRGPASCAPAGPRSALEQPLLLVLVLHQLRRVMPPV